MSSIDSFKLQTPPEYDEEPQDEPISDDDECGSRQSAPHETQQGADTPGHRASEAAGNVADPHCTPIGHRGAESSSVFLVPIEPQCRPGDGR